MWELGLIVGTLAFKPYVPRETWKDPSNCRLQFAVTGSVCVTSSQWPRHEIVSSTLYYNDLGMWIEHFIVYITIFRQIVSWFNDNFPMVEDLKATEMPIDVRFVYLRNMMPLYVKVESASLDMYRVNRTIIIYWKLYFSVYGRNLCHLLGTVVWLVSISSTHGV